MEETSGSSSSLSLGIVSSDISLFVSIINCSTEDGDQVLFLANGW